jgi:replicative DNA helicase
MQPNPTQKKKRWVHISEAYREGVIYAEDRRTGKIASIQTPWDRFNDAGINGLEWGTITVIGARPGGGKTLITNKITREAHKLNPFQKFAVLDFQFEMLRRTNALREFSFHLKKSIKELSSADEQLSDEDLAVMRRYAEENADKNIFIVDEPVTVEMMEQTIYEFYDEVKLPVIITLDHSVLVKRAATEKNQLETLENLGAMATRVKKRIPCMWLILTQLNRSIENIERLKEGTSGNYIITSDIYGADALLMHADIMLGINRPHQLNLKVYGPDRYIVDPNLLAFHFLKVRNGDPRMSFFRAEFEHMNIREIPAPDRVPTRRGSLS